MKETIFYQKKRLPKQYYGYYFKSGIFAQYVTKRPYNHYSSKHWKTHVNYPIYQSEEIKSVYLDTILSFLRENDLVHKIVIKEKDIIYRMNLPQKENTQNGKIITIYYTNEGECYQIMEKLDKLIRDKGFDLIPLREEQKFRNDRIFNNNPYIGYRYASTPRRPYYIIPRDKFGNEIEDIQERFSRQKSYA